MSAGERLGPSACARELRASEGVFWSGRTHGCLLTLLSEFRAHCHGRLSSDLGRHPCAQLAAAVAHMRPIPSLSPLPVNHSIRRRAQASPGADFLSCTTSVRDGIACQAVSARSRQGHVNAFSVSAPLLFLSSLSLFPPSSSSTAQSLYM